MPMIHHDPPVSVNSQTRSYMPLYIIDIFSGYIYYLVLFRYHIKRTDEITCCCWLLTKTSSLLTTGLKGSWLWVGMSGTFWSEDLFKISVHSIYFSLSLSLSLSLSPYPHHLLTSIPHKPISISHILIIFAQFKISVQFIYPHSLCSLSCLCLCLSLSLLSLSVCFSLLSHSLKSSSKTQ